MVGRYELRSWRLRAGGQPRSVWFLAAEFSVELRWDRAICSDEPGAHVAGTIRLTAHEFSWREQPRPKVSDRLTISDVTFPSPVVTEFPENNTVHCEYYRPKVLGQDPGVVVLHILGGDFPLARVFANSIAQRGVARCS